MRAPAAYIQSIRHHFKTANSDWCRVAREFQIALAISDKALLDKRPASQFILTWMWELRNFLKKFGELFGRRKRPPLADDFTAAVALSLEQFLATRDQPSRVRCEQTIQKKRGSIRPDISVLSAAGDLVATVECKTNLGWKREQWKEQWETRNNALLQSFPKCTPYLCVLSQKNWRAEELLKSQLCQKQWFCLSKVSVGKITDPVNDILHPIESLFLSVLSDLTK